MLGLPPSVRIYFATGLVDMRNGIDGLRTIVEQILKRNPNEGHLFVFVGKRRDMLKILFWDKNGYVVYFKRLERGRFQLPVVDEKRVKVEMEAAPRFPDRALDDERALASHERTDAAAVEAARRADSNSPERRC